MTSPDPAEVKRVLARADCVATADEVENAYRRMAEEIHARLQDSNPLILAVMKGGLIVAGQIVPRLQFPLELSYLHLSRYGNALSGAGCRWLIRPLQPVEGRTVLVIDDILDEGHTLVEIADTLIGEGAEKVLSAVLVHKEHDRKARPGMRADFTGLTLPDRYLFGGGMDYKGYWRNAQGIFALCEEP